MPVELTVDPQPGVAARATVRVSELDGIRGTAILLVVIWHYVASQVQTVPASLPSYGLALLSMAWAGVDLFFVLSGFLIGTTLHRNRTASNYFSTFYIRRACRIFPLYFLSLLLFLAALQFGAVQREQGPGGWWSWLFGNPMPAWSYTVYLQNVAMAGAGSFGANWLGITWSLAIEEQFYLIIPLAVRFVPAPTLRRIFYGLIIAAPIFRIALYSISPHPQLAGYVLLPARWDALLLGVLGAYALQQPNIHQRLQARIPLIRGIIAAAALVLLVLLGLRQGIGSFAMGAGGYTVLAVLSLGIVLLALVSEGGRTQQLFRQPVLVWLGTISYGIYLLHQPVSGALHGYLRHQSPRIATASDAVVTVLALMSTLLLAAASARFFEGPFIAAGQRLRYRT